MPGPIPIMIGLTNLQEYQAGSNPANEDTDNDWLPDGWELQHFGNFSRSGNEDPDGDGILNWVEYVLGFDPMDPTTNGTSDSARDTDGDGMPDAWEAWFGHFEWNADLAKNVFIRLTDWTVADAGEDPDGDNLTNAEEYEAGTDPGNDDAEIDTDNDYLPDSWEIQYFSNLIEDGDGDPDEDGVPNWMEYLLGFDPLNAETDGTPDAARDSDGDGMPDAWEASYGHFEWDPALERNIFHPTMDWNVPDAAADWDGDGHSNFQEYQDGTDPSTPQIVVVDPGPQAAPQYQIIKYSKEEFTYYLPQVVSINPTPGNFVKYTVDGTDPRVVSSSQLTAYGIQKITCPAPITIRATASEYVSYPTKDETKEVKVSTDEASFNVLNRRPRYCLRAHPY